MASMQSKQVESSSDVEPITQEHVPTILAAASELVTHPSSLVNTAAGLDHGLHVPAASAQVFTDKEKQIRNKAKRNKFLNILRANFAAILVFLFYLISFQTILSCFLTVALTCYWYQYVQNENVSEWSGSNINWVVLGFAVVTPITVSIGMAFKRREQALSLIARVRSVSFQIYLAHAVWTNWNDGTGRTNQTVNRVSPSDRGSNDSTYNDNIEDWLHHADDVMEHLVAMGDELSRFLTLPSSSRSYHRLLHNGRKEAAEIVELQYKLFDSLYTKRFKKLTILTEKLRVMGLSPPEISRIWQFKQQIAEAIESLRVIKMYRTPQALRSFGRLFIIVLPPLYASSFAQLAFDLQSLPMGIIFAFITPLCLTALFESMYALEDPFVGWITLDGIDSVEEFEVLHWHQLKNARSAIFPNAEPFALNHAWSVSGEILCQKSGDIFDISMYSSQLPPIKNKLCMDNADKISHFALDAVIHSSHAS